MDFGEALYRKYATLGQRMLCIASPRIPWKAEGKYANSAGVS